MKSFGMVVASLGLLAVFMAPATAQKPTGSPGPGPEDEPMARMMKMMGDMQQQMGQMQEQMKGMQGMQGMGGMHGRMGQMRGSMEQMSVMMQEHRTWMKDRCPAATAPAAPKKSD
jgi:TolA-binding protein